MANNNSSKYLNGWFVTEKSGEYGEYLSIGITDDGIKSLQDLPKTDKGFRNFIMSRQKDNPQKYSVKPFAPKGGDNNGGGTDSLPF